MTQIYQNVREEQVQGLRGRVLLCEDGHHRRCWTIVSSVPYPWLYVINESDPESNLGHFVHLLTVVHAVYNKPEPSKEAREAFTRLAKKIVPVDMEQYRPVLTRPKFDLIVD